MTNFFFLGSGDKLFQIDMHAQQLRGAGGRYVFLMLAPQSKLMRGSTAEYIRSLINVIITINTARKIVVPMMTG